MVLDQVAVPALVPVLDLDLAADQVAAAEAVRAVGQAPAVAVDLGAVAVLVPVLAPEQDRARVAVLVMDLVAGLDLARVVVPAVALVQDLVRVATFATAFASTSGTISTKHGFSCITPAL